MFGQASAMNLFDDSKALEALVELEQSSHSAYLKARAHERVSVRMHVAIRPADASRRDDWELGAMTVDLSDGGTLVLAPRPLLAGDFFWLRFDGGPFELGSLTARCLRCRFVREGTFEVAFRFLEQQDLASNTQCSSATDP